MVWSVSFWSDSSDFTAHYSHVFNVHRLSTTKWVVTYHFGRVPNSDQIAEVTVVADHVKFEMLEENK